jgi:hypothetical protein
MMHALAGYHEMRRSRPNIALAVMGEPNGIGVGDEITQNPSPSTLFLPKSKNRV